MPRTLPPPRTLPSPRTPASPHGPLDVEGLVRRTTALLNAGVPLTLLLDLADPAGPRSRTLYAVEGAGQAWIGESCGAGSWSDAAAERLTRAVGTPAAAVAV